MIFVMVGVAFLTLLERKVLGCIHIRKGPNKVGFVGIFQPFRNAIKLFTSEQYFPLVSNYLIYYFSPIFVFFFLCCYDCKEIVYLKSVHFLQQSYNTERLFLALNTLDICY
jgi:NADH-ubiquinone oxidoreductase chain 1